MKKHFFQSIAVALFALFSLTSCDLISIVDNPADDTDNRIKLVVPEELLAKIKDYMPVYEGVNPPNVEGTFIIEPYVYIFDSSGTWDPGTLINNPYILNFTNQDSKTNTLDYEGKHADNNSYQSGKGVFVSGSGNNFTIYFNVEGTANGIYVKDALVISGTITPEGIKDLRRAFVVVDKGEDPEHLITEVGVFRVFKDEDGLAAKTNWEDYEFLTARGVKAPQVKIGEMSK